MRSKSLLNPIRAALLFASAMGIVAWLCCLPAKLFETSYSTVLYSREGHLLSARIAADGQWRFPQPDSIDERYRKAVEVFEDEYFISHPGVNPVSLLRALRQNWQAGKVVSGGSTITMQTVRLMRGGKARTRWEKCIEIAWATRLELSYSKDEIFALYAGHAPFGGNVVGLEAASWRYFGRSATHFSWGEAAALAVLPNAPGVIYPGRSTTEFLRKRNRLLAKLHRKGYFDADDLSLAQAEPLPGKPYPLPDLAPHLAQSQRKIVPKAVSSTKGQRASFFAIPTSHEDKNPPAHLSIHDAQTGHSTLSYSLQTRVRALVAQHQGRLMGNGVHNASAVVLDVATGQLLAYVGNAPKAGSSHGEAVDMVLARRSSGSLLKPFLYAACLHEGRISPRTLLTDIPTLIAGYAPKNFDLTYDGAVPAEEALTRSLNVPHVRLLQEFGVDPFLKKCRAFGFNTLDRSAENYGLSLILGGGEITMWTTAEAYRRLALQSQQKLKSPVSASAAYLTLDALTKLTRPGDLASWRSFRGSRKIAWKTGTSFGHRDAWAVGVTPEYVIVVWAGNADGEGRTGLTGASVAAPLLFDVFEVLPSTSWFDDPVGDMAAIVLCSTSGLQASTACTNRDTLLLTQHAERLRTCSYHQQVWVDKDGQRVDASCAPLNNALKTSAFVLPPAMATYYRKHHARYSGLPDWSSECQQKSKNELQLVYPRGGRQLKLPRKLDGKRQAIAFEVAHARTNAVVNWYLDGKLVQTTKQVHQFPLLLTSGTHKLTWVDERGAQLEYAFRVVK